MDSVFCGKGARISCNNYVVGNASSLFVSLALAGPADFSQRFNMGHGLPCHREIHLECSSQILVREARPFGKINIIEKTGLSSQLNKSLNGIESIEISAPSGEGVGTRQMQRRFFALTVSSIINITSTLYVIWRVIMTKLMLIDEIVTI